MPAYLEQPPALPGEREEVYSSVMTDKPTVAVLTERVRNTTTIFSILGLAAVGVAASAGVFFNNRMGDHGERLAKIEEKLTGIGKSVDRLLDRQATNIIKTPVGQSPEDIQDAIARLRNRKLEIGFDDIHRASAVLVKNPDQRSWTALVQLASFRSSANSALEEARQHIVQTIGPGDHGKWFQGNPEGWVLITEQTLILDPKDQSEVPHLNDAPGHPARVFRNIVFRKCHLIYRGGELTLISVFFDDCTFDIQRSHEGETFAESILNPAPFTTFSAEK
jgi:hypothetical protein